MSVEWDVLWTNRECHLQRRHAVPQFFWPRGTWSCLPGIRLKFSLVTIKFLVKDYTWKELEEPRRPGSQNETIEAEVQWTCSNCPVPTIRSFTHVVVSLANTDYGGLHGGYWCRSAGNVVVCSLKGWKQRWREVLLRKWGQNKGFTVWVWCQAVLIYHTVDYLCFFPPLFLSLCHYN